MKKLKVLVLAATLIFVGCAQHKMTSDFAFSSPSDRAPTMAEQLVEKKTVFIPDPKNIDKIDNDRSYKPSYKGYSGYGGYGYGGYYGSHRW